MIRSITTLSETCATSKRARLSLAHKEETKPNGNFGPLSLSKWLVEVSVNSSTVVRIIHIYISKQLHIYTRVFTWNISHSSMCLYYHYAPFSSSWNLRYIFKSFGVENRVVMSGVNSPVKLKGKDESFEKQVLLVRKCLRTVSSVTNNYSRSPLKAGSTLVSLLSGSTYQSAAFKFKVPPTPRPSHADSDRILETVNFYKKLIIP